MKHLGCLARVALNLSTRLNELPSMIGSTSRLARLTGSSPSHVQVLQQPQLQNRVIRAHACRAKTPKMQYDHLVAARRCCTVARAASIDETDVANSTAQQGSLGVPSLGSSVNQAATEEHGAHIVTVDHAQDSSEAAKGPESSITPITSSSSTTSIPKLAGSLDAVWSTFIAYLWEKGFFSEHTSPDRASAVTSKRDVKKALQQLGRDRPDIIHLMPKTLIRQLSDLEMPFPGDLIINRKTLAAAGRLAAAAAAADGLGKASTQDVLRLSWLYCSEQIAESAVESATTTVTAVLQTVLELQQQPPQPELLAAAAAAAATPDQQQYKLANLGSGPRSQQQQQQQQQQREERLIRQGHNHASLAKPDRSSSSSGSSRVIPAAAAADVPAAILHKLRVLKLSPFVSLKAGDWFCGVCGYHQFKWRTECANCGAPEGSLGNSTVSKIDVLQLSQVGLSQEVPFEARNAKIEYADQLAAILSSSTSKTSLTDAMKIAGLQRFTPPPTAAAAAAGSSSVQKEDRKVQRDRAPRGSQRPAAAAAPQAATAVEQEDSGSGQGDSSSSSSSSSGREDRPASKVQQDQQQQPLQRVELAEVPFERPSPAARAPAAAAARRTTAARSSSSSSAGSLSDVFKNALSDSAAALRAQLPDHDADSSSSTARPRLFERRSTAAAAQTVDADAAAAARPSRRSKLESASAATAAAEDQPQQRQQQQPQSAELGWGRVRRSRATRTSAAAAAVSSSSDLEDDFQPGDAGPEGLTRDRRYDRRYRHDINENDNYDDDEEIISTGRRFRGRQGDSYNTSDVEDSRRYDNDRPDRSDNFRSDRYDRPSRYNRKSDRYDNQNDGTDDDLSGWASEFGDDYRGEKGGSSSRGDRRGDKGSSSGWGDSSRRGRGNSRSSSRRDGWREDPNSSSGWGGSSSSRGYESRDRGSSSSSGRDRWRGDADSSSGWARRDSSSSSSSRGSDSWREEGDNSSRRGYGGRGRGSSSGSSSRQDGRSEGYSSRGSGGEGRGGGRGPRRDSKPAGNPNWAAIFEK